MLNSNTFLKILSVIIAIVMWVYVIEVTNPMKPQPFSDVPVQLLNEESLAARGLALSGEANYTVDVKVEAKKADLSKLSSRDIIVQADLFGYSMGKNYIPVMVKVPDGVNLISYDPIKINVVIEELVEVPKPIKVVFVGPFEENIEAGQVTTQPGEILVSGAKSEVGAVSYIRAEVNTAGLTADGNTIQAKAVAVNRSDDVVQNVRMSSSYVDVSARLSQVKAVPLTVDLTGEVAPIYEVTNLDIPETVKIKGTRDALAGITELAAEPLDITSVSNTSKLPLKIVLPAGVEFAYGYENLSVGITIKPVATKQFVYTANEIKMEGIDEGTGITVTTPQITVTASGSQANIATLKKEDLEPYIELNPESLISATAKVQVRYDKQLGHIAVDPEEVHITLNQTE